MLSALIYVLDFLGSASDVLCTFLLLLFLAVLKLESRGVKKDSILYVRWVILAYVSV